MSYGGKTTNYLQDIGTGLPVLQEAVVSQTISSYLYPLGSTTPLYQDGGSGLWYHGDGLGSVRALTNGSGAVAGDYTYSAFGLNQATGDTGLVEAPSTPLTASQYQERWHLI